MQEERAKVSALQSAHVNLETELRETKNQEVVHRRGLLAANDELAKLKKIHEQKIQDLDSAKTKAENELAYAREDYRLVLNDLKMERDTNTALKASIAQQANVQHTLQAQLEASRQLAQSLQEEVEKKRDNASEMEVKFELTLKRNAFLEAEAIANEQIRRKLHNQIMELKGELFCTTPKSFVTYVYATGNIRVYVRVRPVIRGEKDEASGEASIAYPDQRDHKEIELVASTESAMGSQRKEITSFSFDRVSSLILREGRNR
jgi:kinesin family protein C1